jgi:hypothetical protein
MKFTRSSSSKDVEAATDSNASPVNAKGSSRRFASPKKNKVDGGFDLLASVNGEDDARNDKSSYAQRIFRRPAKPSDAKEPTSPTNSSSLSSLFQFKSSEDNARDAAPSTGTRRRTKEKDGTKSSKSAHPALFQFKSRENDKLKDQSAAKAGTSASPPAQSSSLPSMFQLTSNEKEEATKPVHRRRTKKSEAATTKDTTAVASATPSLFQFKSTEDEPPRPAPVTPILRRRPSKDKDEKEKAPVAASALFPFSSSSTENGEKASARDAASTSARKRSTKAVAAATAATAAVGVAALPAMFQFNSSGAAAAAEAPPTTSSSSRTLFGRKSFDKDEDQATATAAARSAGGGEEVKEGRNPVLMAKLFPKQERKQTKVCYHNFSADAANVVQVEQDETAPKVLYPNHVLIKVQVRLQLCGA